jgi:tetratricopeptide (TPR) repeat protein
MIRLSDKTRVLVCTVLCLAPVMHLEAQAPAPPVAPITGSALKALFTDAEAAFAAKDYATVVKKIEELLKHLGPNKGADPETMELLYFNLGLANILGGKNAEAEAGFGEYLKRFPKGQFASRSFLGMGRAAIDQKTPEKNEVAIKALKIAALDPKFRSEAGLWLGQLYIEMSKRDEAMTVFKGLIGSDVRTPQQTTAAVEVISLLAESGDLVDLIKYLDRLNNQSGIRNAYAWYASQVIVRGDTLMGAKSYEAALAIYRTVPTRSQISAVQKASLQTLRNDVKFLEERVEAEKAKEPEKRSTAVVELLDSLKPAIEVAEKSLATIEERADFDAAILMRRGRAHYYLDRYEEALVAFRTIRDKYSTSEEVKAAAYAEIIILNKVQNLSELMKRCDEYLKKFPDAENIEQVATLAGELLVQTGKWDEIGKFYKGLETKFPASTNIDRYVFFQGVAHFMDANFKESTPIFTRFLKDFPDSPLIEKALYYMAMSHFLSNEYKKSITSITAYLTRFPEGDFAGDLTYRLAFIDFNDKDVDQSNNIIKVLTTFLSEHPDDAAAGSMYCLLADTYKDKKTDKQEELDKFQKEALEAYKKAVWAENPDDVVQYALDSATTILSGNKDYPGIAALHTEFVQKKPNSPLILKSISEIAKMKAREGKSKEACEIIANALKPHIANPASEQVEFLIDELVKAIVPRKKATEVDLEALDKELVEILNVAVTGQANATTTARINYAQARMALLLKRADRANLYLLGIATRNAKDPTVLSPALLSECGDILLKQGNLDDAQAMFSRLNDRYKDGMFADAGPVGLGNIALARKKPAEALEIFDKALNGAGTSRYKETTFGKLQALAALERDDEAQKLALEITGDKMFRGEFAGKSYIILADILRRQASKASDEKTKKELLGQAHGYLQRVYVANLSVPEVAAEAYWQAYETALELKDASLAMNTLRALAAHPKLKNTDRAKKAVEMAP